MMRYIIVLCFALLAFPQAGVTQEGYPNTCDPLNDCFLIAYQYAKGSTQIPKFPKDVKRADALKRMALDASLEGCVNGDPRRCRHFKLGIITLTDLDPNGPYTLWNRAVLAATQTDAQCAAGNPEACIIHIDILRQSTDGISFGAARAMQNGVSLTDANAAIKRKETEYVARSEILAVNQNATLREQCAAHDQQACNALGMLLSWYAKLRTSRYEHLPYLYEACSDEAQNACKPLFSELIDIAMFQEVDNAPPLAPWLKKLEQGCDAQNLTRCNFLALLAEFDKTLDIEALEQKACDTGSPMACSRIGQRLLKEFGKTKDPETLGRATDVLTQACDLKEHYACHILEHISKG